MHRAYISFLKKGDKNNPDNYRGIALLNSSTKLLTTIVTNRIQNFVEKKKLTGEEQFGFRKGKGCGDAIFVLYSAIGLTIRLKQRKVYAIFVDFQKAFDSIRHAYLWRKLKNLGISSKIINVLNALYEKASLDGQES